MQAHQKLKITAFAFSTLTLLVGLIWLSPLHARKKNTDPEIKKREEMLVISRQLSVTCAYCHDVNNFRSSKMRTHKISLDHMRIVDLLNKKGFRGKPKVDCYFCHRGKAKPDYKEKLKL